jgi:hypothetical protein
MTSRATILFREGLTYRREAFAAGLKLAGYAPSFRVTDNPRPGDVLVIWNRTGEGHSRAREFEAAKAKVLVVENGYLGKEWRGEQWFAMARNHHNGAGSWPVNGPERWDDLHVDLAPWREPGSECVILAQRGIGEQHMRAPDGWLNDAVRTTRGRVRRHPGTDPKATPLEHDLRLASSVATWSSGAAIKALILGIPVFYGFPKWIGALAARPLTEFKRGPIRDDTLRLTMLRRLIWAQRSMTEVENGSAFKALLA